MRDLVLGLAMYVACGMAMSFVILHAIDAFSVRKDRRRGADGDNGSAVEGQRSLQGKTVRVMVPEFSGDKKGSRGDC